jgi:uncharacterized membrane protein YphA (DoxX/SURF4 family)
VFTVLLVVAIVFAAVLLFSAGGKLTKQEAQLKTMRTVGFPPDKLWLLAGAEIAGAAGLVIGLFWWPLGVAAAIGLILYFLGATTSHLRVRDPGWPPAVVLAVVSVVVLVLRFATV